jgi:SAM-dependent methyltransferase
MLLFLGPSRTLKFYLRAHWLLRRLAYEVSGIKYGDNFQNSAFGLSDEVLTAFISSGDRVADLGCGVGRWARASARSASQVFGIDTNPTAISEAESLGGGVKYLNIDLSTHLSEMPEVDLVLMIHFLEHIEDPSDLLKGLQEKIKRIMIEVPDFEGDPLNYPRLWSKEPFYYDADHVREFTRAELLTLIESTGWITEYISQKGGTLLIVAKHELTTFE